MPHIVDSGAAPARRSASLCDALRETWGTWRETPSSEPAGLSLI